MQKRLETPESKAQSRKLWTSYGAWDEITSFFGSIEQTSLQGLSRYCYKVAVSRVQTSIKLPLPVYFCWHHGSNFRETLFSFDRKSGAFSLQTDSCFDFNGYLTVQVKYDIYGLKYFNPQLSTFVRYYDLNMMPAAEPKL